MEPSGPILEPPNTSSSSPRASKTIMWSSRTPQRALQQTPRTEFRAPEHLEELSSSLQGPSFELPNTSRSSQAASQDRIPSSRTSRGAVKQPPRNEFRAPKQASQEESKQSKGKQASKQPSKQASNQTSKRANEQASKRASEHTTKRTNKQASKQEVGGVPRRACNNSEHYELSAKAGDLPDQPTLGA